MRRRLDQPREELPKNYIDLESLVSEISKIPRTDPSLKLNRPLEDCENHGICYHYLIPMAHTDPSFQRTVVYTHRPKGEYIWLPPSTDESVFPLTVETVVDWYCQSINRSYASVANPKKSYQCSPLMQNLVKKLFNVRAKDLNDDTKDQPYFKESTRSRSLAGEKRRNEFDPRLLKSKEFKDGIPISEFEAMYNGEKKNSPGRGFSGVKKVGPAY